MKFSVRISDIKAVIDKLYEAIRVMNPGMLLGVSACLMLDVRDGVLTMRISDYTLELSASADVHEGSQDGWALISVPVLNDTLETFEPSEILTVETHEREVDGELKKFLLISGADAGYDLLSRDFPFPGPVDFKAERRVVIAQSKLKYLIDRSMSLIRWPDDFHEYLSRLRLEVQPGQPSVLTSFATDRYTMATAEAQLHAPCEGGQFGAMLTRKSIRIMSDLLDGGSAEPVTLEFSRTKINAVINGYKLTGSLISCESFDFRSAIPDRAEDMIIDRRNLINSLVQVKKQCGKSRRVEMIFGDDAEPSAGDDHSSAADPAAGRCLLLQYTDAGKKSATLRVDGLIQRGKACRMGFLVPLLLPALREFGKCEKLLIRVAAERRLAVFAPYDPEGRLPISLRYLVGSAT